MPVLTIVNHGTANSTDTATSEGFMLVISKIASLLGNQNWQLNQGAGTAALEATGVVSPFSGGVGAGVTGGLGVETNVTRSVAWIKQRMGSVGNNPVINLAGHSRGSITCYKIARALAQDPDTAYLRVNIFAIDPVPGNTGHAFTKNGENYKNIVIGGNVQKGESFLLLAESEHRLIFRPYVDALYSSGMPRHRFDTIPGTHGGINMLGGPEAEAAEIVLSRALEFLKRNGSEFGPHVDDHILNGDQRLERYAEIMNRIKKYKALATGKPFSKAGVMNVITGGIQVDKHRIANVLDGSHVSKHSAVDKEADDIRRKDFHGRNLSDALTQMTGEDANAIRPHRFFCNGDHQALFKTRYTQLFGMVHRLEQSGVGSKEKDNFTKIFRLGGQSMFDNMSVAEKVHLTNFLKKRGIDLV